MVASILEEPAAFIFQAFKVEAVGSSKRLAAIYQTTEHHNPENCNSNIQCLENLEHILSCSVQSELGCNCNTFVFCCMMLCEQAFVYGQYINPLKTERICFI
jgi:hypothetical protein